MNISKASVTLDYKTSVTLDYKASMTLDYKASVTLFAYELIAHTSGPHWRISENCRGVGFSTFIQIMIMNKRL